MVFARTKLTIKDLLFEPIRSLQVNYSGKKAEKFYNKIREELQRVYNVPEGYIQEKVFTWEKKKEGNKFMSEWEVNKILDHWSYINVRVKIKGFGPPEGEGYASINIQTWLFTEYPQDTFWQQNILYEIVRRFWHSVFYHKKRMQYYDLGKKLGIEFQDSIKKYAEELR